MGMISTVMGFLGFGVGTVFGLVIGYFLFIYLQPTDVKVEISIFYFVFFLEFLASKCCYLLFFNLIDEFYAVSLHTN